MILRLLAVTAIYILLSTVCAREVPKLNGLSAYKQFNHELFFVGIYTDKVTSAPADILSVGPRKIQIRVVADKLRYRPFKRLWLEGISINASTDSVNKHRKSIAKFGSMLSFDLLSNDLLSISRNTSGVTAVDVNGIHLGTIEEPGLFNLLALVWLGQAPPSTQFKQGLLAKGNVSTEQLARFEKSRPKKQRIAYIRQKLIASEAIAAAIATDVEAKNAGLKKPKPIALVKAAKTNAGVVKNKFKVSAGNKASPRKAIAKTFAKSKTQDVKVGKSVAKSSNEKKLAKIKAVKKPNNKVSAIKPASTSPAKKNKIKANNKPQKLFASSIFIKQQRYFSQLRKWTDNFVQYPKKSLKKRHEGTVELSVMIDRMGRVVGTERIRSSGKKLLDKAAIEIVKAASPYPPIPHFMDTDTYSFTVPVVFELGDLNALAVE